MQRNFTLSCEAVPDYEPHFQPEIVMIFRLDSHLSIRRVFTLVLLQLLAGLPAYAAFSNEREQLIAERLQQRVKVGVPVLLQANSRDFISLFTEQMTSEPQGGVILLHSLGAHPDWPIVTTALRKSLPQRGWATLSIQLPVLPPEDNITGYGATLDEASERITQAQNFLIEQELSPIVIIGYSFGGATALQHSARQGDSNQDLIGVAVISPVAQPFLRPTLDVLEQIEAIKIPILDVYGTRDFREIIEQAPDRRLAARKGDNPWYEQIQIEGADHDYSGLGLVLTKRISGWLKKVVADYQAQQDNESDKNAATDVAAQQ